MNCNPKQLWQYRKIELQNQWNGKLISYANEKGIVLSKTYNTSIPSFEEGVDPENAHASIQAKMEQAEQDFASITEEILAADNANIEGLKEVSYLFGYELSKETYGVTEAYQLLNDTFLDGMPCDMVNEVAETTETRIAWNILEDMHARYWKDASVYDILRTSATNGVLAKSGFAFGKNGNHASLKKKSIQL